MLRDRARQSPLNLGFASMEVLGMPQVPPAPPPLPSSADAFNLLLARLLLSNRDHSPSTSFIAAQIAFSTLNTIFRGIAFLNICNIITFGWLLVTTGHIIIIIDSGFWNPSSNSSIKTEDHPQYSQYENEFPDKSSHCKSNHCCLAWTYLFVAHFLNSFHHQ